MYNHGGYSDLRIFSKVRNGVLAGRKSLEM